MDEQRQGRSGAMRRTEQIDGLARRRAIGEAEFGAPGLLRLGAVGGGVALPAGENLRMIGNAGAIVVLGFVIDRHAPPRPVGTNLRHRPAGRKAWSCFVLAREPGYDRAWRRA